MRVQDERSQTCPGASKEGQYVYDGPGHFIGTTKSGEVVYGLVCRHVSVNGDSASKVGNETLIVFMISLQEVLRLYS